MSEQITDLKTWSKGFDAAPAAGGKTISVFDLIGTITIPNKKEPLYMYGILALIIAQAQTAGESGHPVLQIDSSDLGLIKERFNFPEFGFIDPIATNSQAIPVKSQFMAIPIDKKVNNQAIDISLSSNTTMTADWNAHVSVVFGNQPLSSLPKDYLEELKNNFTAAARGLGRVNKDAAAAVASADTDITLSGIAIPNKAKGLVSLTAHTLPNAPTAAEEVCTRHTYSSGDMSDFEPQEYPSAVGYHPGIGTIVGGAKSTPFRKYPVRFPLPESVFTMSVKAQNVLVLSNAPDFSQGVNFRPK